MKPPFYKIPSPTPEDPFPQKDAEGACATSVDAGGASDPLPQETGTSTPFPLTPTSLSLSLYKGVTDRAQTQSSSEPLSLHPLSQVKIILVNFW